MLFQQLYGEVFGIVLEGLVMGKNRFSRIAFALALTAFSFLPTACAERQVVIPTAETPSPPASSLVEKTETPPPPTPDAVQKQEKPRLFLLSDLWYGNNFYQSPETKGAATDLETYRAQQLADFNSFLSDTCATKTPQLKGFDHFLNAVWEDAGKYIYFGAGLVGYLETRHPK